MKKIISIMLFIILLVQLLPMSIVAGAVTTDTYYIDSVNGNNTNSGLSPASPWKSVQNVAALTLKPGDSILFCRGGQYECDCLTLTCSGEDGKPVVISSYGNQSKPLPLLYTNKNSEILRLFDCSYITVSNLEMTAHNGGGIWIDTLTKESDSITLSGLKIHDIQNVDQNSRDTLHLGAAVARACVMVKGLPARSQYPVNNLTIRDCEMYDCGNGISLWGSWNEGNHLWFNEDRSVPPVFNENALVENIYFHDMTAEAIIVGICKNSLVTHCRAIDCCLDEGTDENGNISFFNAAMWFWGSSYSTIEYCEIAGQKNKGDGMSVDFDSYSNNCTYQYIYSHDNNCFMCNNAKDDPQCGNTVRYCLSVNDNALRTRFSTESGEYGFKFYNNTLINCGELNFMGLHNALIANNIFCVANGKAANSDFEEMKALFKWGNTYTNNCYYNCPTPIVDARSMNAYPGFCGTDTTDPNSFRLAEGSKLIGAGCEIEDELNVDFYGNPITKNNIGCFCSNGISSCDTKSKESFFAKILRIIRTYFMYVIYKIGSIFEP